MKQVIIFLVLLTMSVANAQSMFDGMSKEQLAEYEITVTHKPTGKVVGKMSRAEYKVVKIGEETFTKEEVEAIVVQHIEEVKKARDTRVRFMGGLGPTGGLEKSEDGSTMSVKTEQGALIGVGVDQVVTDDGLSVGVQGLSNGTVTLGVGVDF